MSEVRLNILDGQRSVAGTVHGSVADAVVAALSAEPETIGELEHALARFIKPGGPYPEFSCFHEGIDTEPWDAGIVFIDLAAHVVAAESSYSMPAAEGQIRYHDGHKATRVSLPYCVPGDWLFLDSVEQYDEVRDRRRAECAAARPFDARPVLYDAVLGFMVEQCLAAREANTQDAVREIHARWLMTPRTDLRGQSPRDVLLGKREFIDADLQSRETQWSLVGEPAPPLPRESAAYRFAGFGTHEVVTYYELVRYLISECWQRVSKESAVDVRSEVSRLAQIKQDWLECPQPEDGRAPAFVIECERLRLPLIMTAEECRHDDDDKCPLCEAIGNGGFGPMFCHLDGWNMDDDFAFSLCLTREEWEDEQAGREADAEELRQWLRKKEDVG